MTLLAVAVAAALLLLAGFAAAAGEAGPQGEPRLSACDDAEIDVDDAETRELRKAVLCLINRARAEHDAGRLERQKSLQKAAQKHAHVMAATDCLAFRCPGEPSLEGRLRKAGYFEDALRWEYAENTGCARSAEAMVESWLGSTFHRLNLLDAKFADVGVGVSLDNPPERCEPGFATFVATFGWRKP